MRQKIAKKVVKVMAHITLDVKTDKALKAHLKAQKISLAEYIRNLIVCDLFDVMF